jgi:hypothetical protein
MWQSWRLSSRWFSWVLPASIAMCLAIVIYLSKMLHKIPIEHQSTVVHSMARGVFMIAFGLACVTTFISLSLRARKGFPFSFEYRLPVGTRVLVCVPVLMQALMCSAIYAVPVLTVRVVYDMPIPIMPAVMMLSLLAVAMMAGSWSFSQATVRGAAMTLLLLGYSQFFAWLKPISWASQSSKSDDIIALSLADYSMVVVAGVLLLAILIRGVRLQRCDERWHWRSAAGAALASASKEPGFISALHERLMNRIAIPCPRSVPWRAEVWLEFLRYGLPILIYSALLAVSVSLLLLVAARFDWLALSKFSIATSLWIFFGGIGIAIFNRRELYGGYMSSFEGTRRLTTAQLAAVQVLMVAASTFIGCLLLLAAFKLAELLMGEPLDLVSWMQSLRETLAAGTLAQKLIALVCIATLYLTSVALFACLHACSVFWGKRFLLSVLAVAFYSIVAAFLILDGAYGLTAIQYHIWGVALLVLLVSVLTLVNLLRGRLVSAKAWAVGLSGWALSVVCSVATLDYLGIKITTLPPELIALNLAGLALPFTLFVLTLWSYDRLRHR